MAQKSSKVAKKPAGKSAIASRGSPGKVTKAASHSKPSTKTAMIKAKAPAKSSSAKVHATVESVKPKAQTKPALTKTVEKKPLAKIAKIEKKSEVVAVAPKRVVAKVAPPKATAAVQPPNVAVHAKSVVAAVVQPKPPVMQAPPAQRAIPAVVKPAQTKLTAPATPSVVATAAQAQAAAAQAAAAAGPKKPVSSRHGFKTNESIVYPAHGVGRIIGIEEQEIAGITLELFVIQFEKDKMTLRVPTSKLASVGMRKLAEDGIVKKAMETLKGKARIKRTMWSRRAQEYEAKINSGDLVSIAEVVRDLYRSEAQPEQSYSERQLYEAALDRMAREIAAVDKVDERGAMQSITEVLSKSAKGRRAAEEEVIAAEAAVKAA